MAVAGSYITRAAAIWAEHRHSLWQSYDPAPADEKRLWAIVFAADWAGTPAERMERLLELLPLAVIAAGRLPAFITGRVSFWSICRSAAGIERLAGGLAVESDTRGRWDCEGRVVVWASLPPDQGAALLAMAQANGISTSAVIGRLIELYLAD